MFELRTVQSVASRLTKYIIPAAIYILVYGPEFEHTYIHTPKYIHKYIHT